MPEILPDQDPLVSGACVPAENHSHQSQRKAAWDRILAKTKRAMAVFGIAGAHSARASSRRSRFLKRKESGECWPQPKVQFGVSSVGISRPGASRRAARPGTMEGIK